MIDSPIHPTFHEVDEDEATAMIAEAQSRRDWSEVRKALLAGGRLFFSDDQFTTRNAKYLTLSFQRDGAGQTLHVRRTSHLGTKGRLVWLGVKRGPGNLPAKP